LGASGVNAAKFFFLGFSIFMRVANFATITYGMLNRTLNHSMQRMKASRSALFQFGCQRRLARTADGERSVIHIQAI
jgi:hypothetical protein